MVRPDRPRIHLNTFAFFLVFALAWPAAAFADVLAGRVVDPQDRPVAHARVLVVRGATVIATLATDSSGRFGPITLPAGEYDILASAPGLGAAPQRATLTAAGTTEVAVKLALSSRSESVVISASQVDRPLSRVTDSVTIIDRSDLAARQAEGASELLRSVPGFGVVTSGGRGAITSLFPRGGESDYTHVLVDGIPMNAFGGGFDAAHLLVAGVDRVEVVRGPQSALFGSGAIGGLINVVTRRGGPPQASAFVEAGQQGTSRLSAETSGGHRAWSWGASFERLASDGDTSFRESIDGNVTNDDYERLAGSAGLGWSDRSSRRLRVDVYFGRDERGNPGPYGSDPLNLYSQIESSRGENRPRGVAASAVFGDARLIRHAVQATWSHVPSKFTTVFGTSEDETRRKSLRYQADVERGAAGLSLGAELVREQADNTFVTDAAFAAIPVERTLTGLFAETRWDPGARAAVTAGVRLERIHRAGLPPDAFGSRPELPADDVWSLNPKFSVAWFVRGSRNADASTGWTKIRAGAGTGIKPPTIFELGFTDNPSLEPERSRSVDAGIEHAFAGRALIADATAFFNQYDDIIIAIGIGQGSVSPFRTDNVANARASGIELGLRWQSAAGVSLRAAYTLLRTQVLAVDNAPGEAPAPFAVGDWLLRRPRHSFSVDARFDRGRWQSFVAVHGRGRTLDLEPNIAALTFHAPGFAVASAGASYRISEQLQAYARVTNLFDRDYEEAFGYPALGRSAAAGIRVAVGR